MCKLFLIHICCKFCSIFGHQTLDPDPYQMNTDPKHWNALKISVCQRSSLKAWKTHRYGTSPGGGGGGGG